MLPKIVPILDIEVFQFLSTLLNRMPNQPQQRQEEEEQPRMNFFTMFLIFMLVRSIMNTFVNPPQQKSPESIIDTYNQTYQTPETTQPDMGSNPFSAMMGMMKGMMPLKKGIKGSMYAPTVVDGEPCVGLSMLYLISSLFTFISLILVIIVLFLMITWSTRERISLILQIFPIMK